MRAIEAIVDEHGTVHLLEAVALPGRRRAIVTILEEGPLGHPHATALLSEQSLGADWNRPEEDAAWAHLQPGP